jgi:hypothetical protein
MGPTLLQINRSINVANGWKRFFFFTHWYPLQLFAWNKFAMKIQQKRKETFLLFFCEATILQRHYNAFESVVMVQKRSTCNETLSKRYRNNSPQQIEMSCETFREKCFENYFATVLQWYLQVETIYSFQECFEGKRLCNAFHRKTDSILPRNDNRFHPFAMIMQWFNLEKLRKKSNFCNNLNILKKTFLRASARG